MAVDTVVQVLGPVRVVADGVTRLVAGRVERAVLATLAIGVGHAVPVDRIAAAVWDDDPPPTARRTIQAYVSRLRRIVGGDRIEYADDAYVLDLDPAAIDAVRFERLAEEARLAVEDDPAGAAGTAREALALWRGRPYGDLTDDEYFTLESHRLEELRLAVLEADLARGALASATAQLESAVEEQP